MRPEPNTLREIALDTKKSLKERKQAAQQLKEQMLNPVPETEFDPDTFEPHKDDPMVQLIPRKRVNPPRRFPRPANLKPKEIMEGQMAGMFESKQELYLLVALLSERVSDLEEALETLLNNRGGKL